MTSVYNKVGMRFAYPENWNVTDEELEEWPRSVALQSPKSTLWTVHLYPAGAEMEMLASEVVEAIRSEYEEVEVEPLRVEMGDVEAIGHQMNFYCLDLLIHAESRCFRQGAATCLVLAQAESRDFEEHRRVMQAMTLSLTLPFDESLLE
ncbi:hypothetical protein [Lignipirellula cremea]|uniref:Uncharacterized protein n=1 Tax=Lignipirellula cremea TaxID=2528010 RepID=A0A518DP32_9BACT|nr:hypothetical protein [Lignipirellula cremea]QDU93598.1 hypothetical protein Pla8534_13780 [Lignipirellula cremea]